MKSAQNSAVFGRGGYLDPRRASKARHVEMQRACKGVAPAAAPVTSGISLLRADPARPAPLRPHRSPAGLCRPCSATARRRSLVSLANEASPAGPAFIGLANELAFASAGGWARVPYGEWAHEEGLQRFGRAEAEEMVRYFKTTWNTLKRAITGLPIYRGHPDLADELRKKRAALANEAARRALDARIAEFERRWPDRREYGSIADLEAREDGLYLRPVLTPAGAALVNEGLTFFSPHWLGRALGAAGGRPVYGPAFLLSIGLTDNPNIAGTSLVNSAPAVGANLNPNPKTTMPQWLIEMLGLANEAAETQETKAKALVASLLKRPEPTALANETTARSTAETKVAELTTQLADERARATQLAEEKTALANERAAAIKGRNEALVGAAIREGRIQEASKPVWLARLERDFAAESVALANESGALKTVPKTGDLGDRKAQATASSKFTALVNERVVKTGESWDAAWHAVKRTAEGKALHNEMHKPAS